MSRKLRMGAAIALLIIASITVATATSFGDDDDSSRARGLQLVAKEFDSSFVDVDPSDLSLGDQIPFTNDLESEGTKVGEDGGVCTVTRIQTTGAFSVYCSASNSLPGGQLTAQGLIHFNEEGTPEPNPYSFAITGGTGRYRNAGGEVVINQVSPTEFHLTFRILGAR